MFRGENTRCNVCNNYDIKVHQETSVKVKAYNAENLDTKMCGHCWKVKDKTDFITDAGNHGVICKPCRDDFRKHAMIVEKAYVQLKKDRSPCVDCGESDIRLLDFDHVDRDSKVLGVSECQSIKQLQTEAAKCVLRCGICHIKRTAKQRNHGTYDKNKRPKLHVKMQNISQQRKLNTGCQSGACKWIDKWKDFPQALHFDHIDPSTKLSNVSEFWNFKTIGDHAAEMDTCQVMCIHCHRLRTFQQFNVKLYNE